MSKFSLEIIDGIILVEPKLFSKSRRPVKMTMALDTGANKMTIPIEIALLLGLKLDQPIAKAEMITVSGIEYAPLFSIPKVKIFGFEVRDVDAVCHDLSPRAKVSGLLGLNILSQFNVHLNFLDNSLEIFDK